MAQFYAGLKGRRGEATRLGDKVSGLHAFVNGWQAGVKINASYNKERDRDEFLIYSTGGSGYAVGEYLGKVYHDPEKGVVFEKDGRKMI